MPAANATHLKVGELARTTGLTVRTLHHYDEIGLLKPSGRSESGYRLYAPGDIARLHGIQALRQMGLSLADIAALFDGRGPAPEAIVEQQMRSLDAEIRRASELRARLDMIREQLRKGTEPTLDDWLSVLRSMGTYGKYFTADELRFIFTGYARLKDDWVRITADVLDAIRDRCAVDSRRVQLLAARWMSLMLAWMGNDFALMRRWGEMYEREPHENIGRGSPPAEVIAFINQAIELRMAAMRRHYSDAELAKFRHVPHEEWRQLEDDILRLAEVRAAAGSRDAHAMVERWLALAERTVGGDIALRDKMLRVGASDPVLAAGAPLCDAAREFLRHAHESSVHEQSAHEQSAHEQSAHEQSAHESTQRPRSRVRSKSA